jgi:formamidopyrimidine-DNA glycosylase
VRDFFAPDGTEGRFKARHLVYGKAGLPCPNGCGRVIRRLQSERSSFICPACQTRRSRHQGIAPRPAKNNSHLERSLATA